jgi:thiol-disulfide isomerase/thioredoxin
MNAGNRALSRRTFLAGLSSMTLTSPVSAQATTWGGGPPILRTGHSQFVELLPLDEVPALTLEGVDGKKVALSAFRGRAVLMNFWATWCPPCRRELPLLDDLRRTTVEKMLEILAVSIDQAGRPSVEAFLKRVGVAALRTFLDPLGRVAKPAGSDAPTPFALWGMPISYIIDREGRLAGYITGEVEWTSEQGRAFLDYYAHG